MAFEAAGLRRHARPIFCVICLLAAVCVRSCGAPAPGGTSATESKERVLLDALRAHTQARVRPEEVSAALAKVEATQREVLADLARSRVVFLRINPVAGLGNRLVAMVSALFVAAATERGLLVDWEAYDEPRTHRSKEVSTMASMQHFFDLPFDCDAAALLSTPEAQRKFGWDYPEWRQVSSNVHASGPPSAVVSSKLACLHTPSTP